MKGEYNKKEENAILGELLGQLLKDGTSTSSPTPENFDTNPSDINTQLDDHTKKIDGMNQLIYFVIGVLVITLVTWYIETFWKFASVKEDYIEKTQEINTKIQLFEKDLDILKSDLNHNNHNQIIYIDSQISKEIERQLGAKIIEFKLNIMKK